MSRTKLESGPCTPSWYNQVLGWIFTYNENMYMEYMQISNIATSGKNLPRNA